MSETARKITKPRVPKPKWLRVKLPTGEEYKKVETLFPSMSYTPFVKAVIALIWGNVGVKGRLPL